MSHAQPPQSPAASSRPSSVPASAPLKPTEPIELTYARHTRNAVVFIAILAGLAVLGSIISAVVIAVQLSAVKQDVTGLNVGSSPSSSICESQGGTDPSC